MNNDTSGSLFKRITRKLMSMAPDIFHKIRRPCIEAELGIVKRPEAEPGQKVLSFCITYRNRFSQITETLAVNLEHNRADSDLIEFVIVQFGGEEALLPWLESNFAEDLASGYLKFFTTEKMPDWHMSIAKNTAHKMASGKIVTNLDCDNYTGERGGRVVIDALSACAQSSFLWQWAGVRGDGTAGRISMTRALFLAMGGYDEAFGVAQQEDLDLMNRLRSQGVNLVKLSDERFSHAILHESGLGITDNEKEIKRLIKENRRKSFLNLLKGAVVANVNRDIGVAAERFEP